MYQIENISRETLAAVETPRATYSHHPIPHIEFLDAVTKRLQASDYAVSKETLTLDNNDQRFFGILSLTHTDTLHPSNVSQVAGSSKAHKTLLGIRSSHDKSVAAGLVVGAGVFVCSNLQFFGEYKVGKKHTLNLRRDLPTEIDYIVGKLPQAYRAQHARINSYADTALSRSEVHDLVVEALDAGVIPSSHVAKVLKEYRDPAHPEFKDQNAWSLFNAFTEVAKTSNIATLPHRTQALTTLFDGRFGIVDVESQEILSA